MNAFQWRRSIGAAFLILGMQCAVADDAIWSRDWTVTAAPTYYGFAAWLDSRPVAVADDGDLIVGSASYAGTTFQVTRIHHDGSLRWSAGFTSPFGVQGGSTMLLPLSDGGAYAGVGLGNEGHVGRFDAAGNIVWSLDLPASRIIALDASRIVASDCTHLTLIDGNAGRVVWQRGTGYANGYCQSTGLVANAGGDIFRASTRTYYEGSIQRAASTREKYDASGSRLWHVEEATDDGTLIAAGNGMVYARTSAGDLRAYRETDGGLAWSTAMHPSVAAAFVDGDPIVTDPDGTRVSRLDASTGQARWTHTTTGFGYPAVADGALFGVDGLNLVKIDVDDGSVLWSRTAPPLNPGGIPDYLDIVSTGTNEVLLEGGSFLYVKSSDGSPIGSLGLPAIPQDMPTTSARLAGGDLFVAAKSATIAPQLTLARLDARDGSTTWQSSAALQVPSSFEVFGPPLVESGVDGTSIVVTSASVGLTERELASVVLVDDTTGAARWNVTLPATDTGGYVQAELYASAPQFDAAGNVYVGIGSLVPCNAGDDPNCGHQALYRLNAADGSVAWRLDRPYSAALLDAPGFFVFGGDVYLAGGYGALSGSPSVEKLAGSSGEVLWASTALGTNGVAQIHATPAGDLIATGSGSARLDALTGATLWSAPLDPSEACATCIEADAAPLLDGDFLITGRKDEMPWFWSWSAADGARTSWTFGPAGDSLSSSAVAVRTDTGGDLWFELVRTLPDALTSPRISFLAPLDLAAHAVGGQQALAYSDGSFVGSNYVTMRGAPDGQAVLIERSLLQAGPGSRLVFEKLDTQVTAHGDLSVTLDLDRPRAAQGDVVTAHAHVAYTGDAPIRGVQIVLSAPWASGIRDAGCSGSDTCTIDTRSGKALVNVDLPSGAAVDIRMSVLALDPRRDEAVFSAAVQGPIGLAETDTLNNFAQATTLQSLFASGFEAAQ